MAVVELLINKTSKEKAVIKCTAMFELCNTYPDKKFKLKAKIDRDVDIKFLGVGLYDGIGIKNNINGNDTIWFKISVDGKYLNGDGIYGFTNPPIMVPDDTESDVEIDGKIVKVKNFKEDVEMAMQSIILQVIGGVD